MRKLIGLSIAVMIAFSANALDAQEKGLFSGSGFKDGFGSTESSNSNTGTSAFGFYRGNKNKDQGTAANSGFQFPKIEFPKIKAPKFEMPKLFQGDKFPSPIQLSDSESKGLFGGFPKFSAKEPGQTSFFQRMNERTKEIFGRNKSANSSVAGNNVLGADKSTQGTWDRITRGLNGDIGGSGNRNQPPIQPNLRTARQPAQGSASKKY